MESRDTFQIRFSVALAGALIALLPALVLPLWALRGLPDPVLGDLALGIVANYSAMAAILAAALWFVSRLEIDSGGIRLYRMQSMTWKEITHVRIRRWLFLDYLRLERREGRPRTIPLYFVGARSIRESLRDFAPENSLVHSLPANARSVSG